MLLGDYPSDVQSVLKQMMVNVKCSKYHAMRKFDQNEEPEEIINECVLEMLHLAMQMQEDVTALSKEWKPKECNVCLQKKLVE